MRRLPPSSGPTHRALRAVLIIATTLLLLSGAGWPAPANASFPTAGAIGAKHRALGGAKGALGAPTSAERCGLTGGGCVQSFQNGAIHWSKASGAHPTKGAIQRAWRDSGWEKGPLGYPTSSEQRSGGAQVQQFQRGRITWTSAAGAKIHLDSTPPPTTPTAPSSFALKGSGFGHGVGMSQYGARGMAAAGRTSTQILEHYYAPAKVTSRTSGVDPEIRVQLLTGRDSTTITPNAGRLRVKAGGTTVESAKAITITRSGQQVRVAIEGRTLSASWVTVEWQGTRAWSGSQSTTVSIPGAAGTSTGTYRHGKIEVRLLGSSLNVLNLLRTDSEYLPGVAEMPSSWHAQALQAQAIAARTYAYRNIGANPKPACGCDVYDEVNSQKFLGWGHEGASVNAPWVKAVADTTRRSGSTITQVSVVMHGGALIDAVYSSSAPGRTHAAADVWGSNVPYLSSRDDPWSKTSAAGNPYASWTASVSQAQARSAFGLADISTISLKRTASGLVSSATATSTAGKTATRTGAQLRSSWGLRSASFTIG